MTVYAIATKISECYGHGDYGEELAIKQVDAYHNEGRFMPVYTDKKLAENALREIRFNREMVIVELEVKTD